MKKRYIVLLILLLIPFVKINAFVYPIEEYINGKPYYSGNLIIDSWGYDTKTNKYIKTDKNGNKLLELDNANDDPISPRGEIEITATVPGNMYNEQIEVVIMSGPYSYTFTLNKDNDFKVKESVIEGTYNVNYVAVINNADDYQIDYPTTVNVFQKKTSSITLDYSQYKKLAPYEKKKNSKRIIVYIFIGIAVVFIIAIVVMVYKAKNV